MSTSQQQLQDILLKGKVDATTYALSTRYLQDEQLALDHYEIQEPDSAGHVKITGIGTKLPFTGMKVEATFQVQAGEIQLKLQASGLDGWNLGKSFSSW